MATLDMGDFSEVAEILGQSGSEPPQDGAPQPGRRFSRKRLVAGALLLVLFGTAATAFIKLGTGLNSSPVGSLTTYTVKPGDLLVSVTEEGSLDSTVNTDVKCMVPDGGRIVWVVEDGKEVSEGEEILRFDASKLEEEVEKQKIAYEKARAADVQATKDFATAEIAVREYVDGTFKKDFREAESKVAVALGNLRSAENALQHGERMFRKGYISPLQLEAQKVAVARAKLDHGTAELAKDVLERFTKPKMTQDLENKRDAAAAKRDSEKASLALEKSKLERLTAQFKNCVVRATKPGLVIYANDHVRWNPDSEVKVGMRAYEGQTILRLPDLNTMRVKVVVHESKVDQLRKGMRARIRVLDREFQGTVVSIANRPEPDWFNDASKKFAVKVDLDGKPKDLRPGMTSEVEILVAHLENVISLPVAAVAEQHGQNYCCVKKGTALERRSVVLGQGNDKFVEIKEGVEAGEEVVLNPRAALGETGEESQKQPETDVKKKFGTGAAKSEAGEGDGNVDGKGNEKTEIKGDGKSDHG
jgi:multidrug efflux pump subunit AcrA (membrane-fusion protein)